jgi:hypothetical protein
MDPNAPPPQPDPAVQLQRDLYYQLVHALSAALPPPLADTPEELDHRDRTAIGLVACLRPVNAEEVAIGAHFVATYAHAMDCLGQMRKNAGQPAAVKLEAQARSAFREARGARSLLLRVQTQRHKREKSNAACDQDVWAAHIALSLLTEALDQAPPAAAAPPAPESAPDVAPPPHMPAPDVAQAPSIPALADEPPPPPIPAPVAEAQPPPIPAPNVALPPPNPTPAAAPPPLPIPASAAEAQPTPVPASAAAQPPHTPAPAAEAQPPPIPAPAAEPPPPPIPAPAAAPPQAEPSPPPAPTLAEDGEPYLDLDAEADRYAIVYPRRAWLLRKLGRVPDDCDFGPPEPDLVHAIVTGTSPALRALDGPTATP